MYVTDIKVHAVFYLKINPKPRILARLGRQGYGILRFDEPRQLSIAANGDVYIADRDNDRVKILDFSLHPLRDVTHPSMRRPLDVKLTTKEMVRT